MKKVFINVDYDYIDGHLRYGHREGAIEMTDEEYEAFISADNKAKYLKENDIVYDLKIVIDDYEVDGCGDICGVEWEVL